MEQSEFDKFAEEYHALLAHSTRISGEDPDFFAEYKIQDVAKLARNKQYPDNLRILDFGAGIGTSVPYFRKYFPGSRVTCLVVSEKSLQLGKERFPTQAEFTRFDGENIPYPDNYYHLAFAACVFHHIDAHQHLSLLMEIKRILKPNGTVIIFEHNPINPLTVRVVNSCPFDENAVLIRAGVMQNRIADAGFVKSHKHYRLFFPRFLNSLKPLEKYLHWLPLGAQYYVCGEKAP
jgi:ubiquinone/menaquinone biosynthesis C-methylase UbiE